MRVSTQQNCELSGAKTYAFLGYLGVVGRLEFIQDLLYLVAVNLHSICCCQHFQQLAYFLMVFGISCLVSCIAVLDCMWEVANKPCIKSTKLTWTGNKSI